VCAHAVRVAIQKLPGVESVNVSLERAVADIRLSRGNTIELSRLRQITKQSGFVAKESTVTVIGTPIERGGKPALEVSGTEVVMLIVPDPAQPGAYKSIEEALRAKRAQPIELRGIVESAPDQPDRITAASVGPPGK
jgi:copper chaperone CopZ